MIQNEEQPPKGGCVNEFLWRCAGVDVKILRKCSSDHAKYSGMGGTILATAVFAALSGGYAFFVIFKSIAVASILGLIWGMVILNIDRFMVSSMFSDGKSSISLKEIAGALPRICIAFILAIVISNPLELRIFEREINYEIEQLKNSMSRDAKLIALSNELDELKYDLNKISASKQNLENKDSEEILQIEEQMANRNVEIKEKEQEIEIYKKQQIAVADNYDGYAARLEAFEIVRDKKREVNMAAILIMVLFIVIEIAPTIFKLMIPAGPYDDMLAAEKHRLKLLSEKLITDTNTEIALSNHVAKESSQRRLELEIANNEKINNMINEARFDVMSRAVNRWKEIQMERAENNPELYIDNK